MLKATHLTGFSKRVGSSGPAPVSDSDAQAFLTAAGIVDPTQRSAVNQLVIDLKAATIWTKLIALYPFVGGTAASHKWNLKDPTDSDGAFRITWNGMLTHNANGVVSNGSTGYGDTHLDPSSNGMSDSIGVWVDDSVAVNQCAIGSETVNLSQASYIVPHWFGDGNIYCAANGAQSGFSYIGTGSSLLQVWREDSTSCFYQTGTASPHTFSGAFNAPTHNIYICALNQAGTAGLFYSNAPLKLAYVGGISSIESDDFYTAVASFQATLGR